MKDMQYKSLNKLLFILLFPISVFSQSKKSTVDSMRVIFFELLNQHRIDNNVNPFIISDSLNTLAQSRAKYIFDTGEYNHISSVPYENIKAGRDISMYFDFEDRCFRIFNGWKKSPGHNRNYLYHKFTNVGFGSYKGYSVVLFSIE